MKPNEVSRREFMIRSSAALAGGLLASSFELTASGANKGKSRVVLIRDEDLLDPLGKPNPDAVRRMLDEALTALFQTKDAQSAWRKIAGPKDVVGIKSNAWRYLPTPPELESAIKAGVMSCGVAEEDISIDDRGVLKDPVFRRATVLVNARPLRTHYWSGLGTCIKNYIMFVENPPDYHGDSCADLASIWKQPRVVGRTRLNVLVMFTPLFHGVGPHHFNPEYTWRYRGLIVSADPVAVDAVGMRIITAKRREHFGEDRPINPPPKHIELAETRHGLGVADPAKIDLVKLGWKEGILI